MNCCPQCQAADVQFGAATARRDLQRYRKKGPDNTTRLLLEAIRAAEPDGGTLLDIGAGVGVIHHELLDDRVASATHVEAASAYIAEAHAETERRNHADRVAFVHGDFVDLATRLQDADIVTVDRVICCYPDFRSLIDASARKARRLYALSCPHDRWYIRFVVALQNLGRRITGNAFRTFVHPTSEVDEILSELGFRPRSWRGTLVWHAVLYERKDTLRRS